MKGKPISGRLKDHSLAKVLMGLSRGRETGVLAVSSQGVIKKIYLSKGDAVFASSTYEDDRLGEMLIKAGKITVQQYDKSVEMLKKTGKRQGAILVELGYLTPKDLFWGVKFQVKEIIYSLFHLEDGDFEFTPGPLPAHEVITLKMSMGNLIYEGVKRIENWTRIRREMPDTDAVLKLSDDPMSLFQGVELANQDKKILSLIDGKRAIRKIIEDSWLNSFEALKTLYLLWSLGIVMVGEGQKPGVSVEDILSPISEEEEAFMRKVNDIFERLDSINYFELLGLPETANSEAVRKSYYAMAKEFHPDRFFDSTDTAMKDKLSQIFDSLTDAYNAVKDEEGRRKYLLMTGHLESGMPSGSDRAQEDFGKGIELIKAGDAKAAAQLLERATKASPSEPSYWNYLALSLSKLPGRDKDAEQAMREAIKHDPTNSEYYTNLGLLCLKAKKNSEAKNLFLKALALDPDNEKAKKALERAS